MTNPTPREFEIVIDGAIFWADFTEGRKWNIHTGAQAEDGPSIGRVGLTEDGAGFKAEAGCPGGEVKLFPIVHFREAVAWLAEQAKA